MPQPAVRLRLLRGLPQHQRQHAELRRADRRAARRATSAATDDPRSADRPAVPEQPDSRESHRPGRAHACSTSSCRAPTAAATATSSRPTRATTAISSACASTTTSPTTATLLGALHPQPDRAPRPADDAPDRHAGEGDAAGLHGRRHAHLQPDGDQQVRGSRTTASPPARRRPADCRTPPTASTCRRTSSRRAGSPTSRITGFFSLGDAAAAVRRAAERSVALLRRLHLDSRPAFVQVRRRSAARAHVHRVREPAERRLHVHRRRDAADGNAAADFLLGLPAQFRRTTAEHAAGRPRLALRRLRAGRVPAAAERHAQRSGCATRCRCRSSTRTTR